MAKKPAIIEEAPQSLINLDPCSAARSIAAAVSDANGETDWLNEKITIQFFNIEQPGKTDQHFVTGPVGNPDRVCLAHQEITELTRAWVRFIESRQSPIWDYEEDAGDATKGKRRRRVKKLVGYKPRFQCREVRRVAKQGA